MPLGNRESPDAALNALVDVERLTVRADVDPVRSAHVRRDLCYSAVRVDAPELAGAILPVRVAGVERSIRADCEIVRLIHSVVMREDRNSPGAKVDPKHIVVRVVGYVHLALPIESDPVANAAGRQLHEHLAAPL